MQDLKIWSGATTYWNPLTIHMRLPLNERFVISFPIDTTIRHIKEYFSLEDWQIQKMADNKILVYIKYSKENLELLRRAMFLCGYFLSFPREESLTYGEIEPLQFEKRFDEDISESLKKEERI